MWQTDALFFIQFLAVRVYNLAGCVDMEIVQLYAGQIELQVAFAPALQRRFLLPVGYTDSAQPPHPKSTRFDRTTQHGHVTRLRDQLEAAISEEDAQRGTHSAARQKQLVLLQILFVMNLKSWCVPGVGAKYNRDRDPSREVEDVYDPADFQWDVGNKHDGVHGDDG